MPSSKKSGTKSQPALPKPRSLRKQRIVAIVGPTASGKSSLACKLTRKFHGVIVNADSRQIYLGLKIGSAMPSPAEQRQVPHKLFGFVSPKQSYSVAQYQQAAFRVLSKLPPSPLLKSRGGIRGGSFLVGGTGLYVQAVVDNLQFPRVAPSPALRRRLEKQTTATLLRELRKRDPETFQRIDRKNPRRLIRALEVCILAKKPFSQLRKKGEPRFDVLQIGLNPDRKTLERALRKRLRAMIHKGLEREVRRLVKKYGWEVPAMSGIGYRQWQPYFDGHASKAEVFERIIKDDLAHIRRQMTWFKRDQRIHWIRTQREAERLVRLFLHQKP